ncbi:MAG: branched-chain amino acid ABC transporter permease [Deltaproteobacteria bacterium]|nr:branched-chain amino acid ABC transporter permease [Deltaproteobacteria bacterium]
MDVFIYGVVRSAEFLLVAMGFSFVYGISRLPNFAHGALYVLTSFITWIFLRALGWNYFLSILLSIIIVTLIGAAIYRFFLIRVRGMEMSEIIASYALGLAILEGLRIRFVGASFATPRFVDGIIEIGEVPIDLQRVIVIAMGLSVVVVMWAFTHYTKVGRSLRAIAQNERAAMMLGIDSDRAATIALAFGSTLVALAAVVLAPTGSLTVDHGYEVLIYAIAVCIIGGLGSWVGTILASFILGFAGILTATFAGGMWQSVVIIAAIVITLIIKPSGLFGRQKELEERV